MESFGAKQASLSGDIEGELRDIYLPVLTQAGSSVKEAKEIFSNAFRLAKEQSIKEGTFNLPVNYGDYLLENEKNDVYIKEMLENKRREGVTDADIKWWWNMHDFERRIMQQIDNFFRVGAFSGMRANGVSEHEAAISTRKKYPIYGINEDTSNATGDDRPLPHELKHRINLYISERSNNDPGTFKKKIKEFSTFNSFIRYEIKNGNLKKDTGHHEEQTERAINQEKDVIKTKSHKEPSIIITISFGFLVLLALVVFGITFYNLTPDYYIAYASVIKIITAIIAVKGYKFVGAKIYEYLIMTVLMFMPIGNLIVVYFAGKSLARDFVNRRQ